MTESMTIAPAFERIAEFDIFEQETQAKHDWHHQEMQAYIVACEQFEAEREKRQNEMLLWSDLIGKLTEAKAEEHRAGLAQLYNPSGIPEKRDQTSRKMIDEKALEEEKHKLAKEVSKFAGWFELTEDDPMKQRLMEHEPSIDARIDGYAIIPNKVGDDQILKINARNAWGIKEIYSPRFLLEQAIAEREAVLPHPVGYVEPVEAIADKQSD